MIFRRIENAGRGAALNVSLDCPHSVENMNALLGSKYFSLIRSGAAESVDGRVVLNWNAAKEGYRMIAVSLEIYYWDSLGRRYVTFQKMIVSQKIPMFGAEDVAPGVVITQRYTKVTPLYTITGRLKYSRFSPWMWLTEGDKMIGRKVARRCHWVALVFEAVGSLFIFLEASRMIAQLQAAGHVDYTGVPPLGYRGWLHDSGSLGFGLLLFGILLAGVALFVENRSEP